MIIFIVGGTTYEEARAVSLQNATNSGIRFILGGTSVLNSKRYVCLLVDSNVIKHLTNVILNCCSSCTV